MFGHLVDLECCANIHNEINLVRRAAGYRKSDDRQLSAMMLLGELDAQDTLKWKFSTTGMLWSTLVKRRGCAAWVKSQRSRFDPALEREPPYLGVADTSLRAGRWRWRAEWLFALICSWSALNRFLLKNSSSQQEPIKKLTVQKKTSSLFFAGIFGAANTTRPRDKSELIRQPCNVLVITLVRRLSRSHDFFLLFKSLCNLVRWFSQRSFLFFIFSFVRPRGSRMKNHANFL